MDEVHTLWVRIIETPDAVHRVDLLKEFLDHPRAETRVVVRHYLTQPATARRTLDVLAATPARLLAEGLLPDLIEDASLAHRDLDRARQVIAALPRDLVAREAWPIAERILARGGWEEPRRLGELFIELGLREPLELLIEFAEGHENVDIAEVAEDYSGVWDTEGWGRPIGGVGGS